MRIRLTITVILLSVWSFQRMPEDSLITAALTGSASSASSAANDPELPRTYLNTDVSPSDGRVIAVAKGGDLQAALNQAQPGDAITLPAGAVFKGNFVLPKKSGTKWIVIRTSTAETSFPAAGTRIGPKDSGAMPKLVSPNSDPVIKTAVGAHHYRFIGIEFGVAPGVDIYNLISFGDEETALSQLPHDLIIDRCYLHGNATGGARRGIMMNSASTAVIDSYLSNFHEVGADSQAIAGWNGSGPFKIVNNYLEGAGENFLLGGADPTIRDLVPSDIEFRQNICSKPLSWKRGHASYAGTKWSVKNLFELKNAQRVLVDGNIFEYNWAEGQDGMAILFTPRNQGGKSPWSVVQDVTFINNTVRHSGGGVNISGPDNEAGPSLPGRRILIRNNLFEDINGRQWGSPNEPADGEFLQILGGAENITVEYNTAFQSGNILMTDGKPSPGLIFRNNIVPHNNYGVIGTDYGSGTSTLNRYFKPYVFQKNVIIGGEASSYPSGNYFIGSFNQVGFVNMAGGDYRLSAKSQYRNASTDGKDIGFTDVQAAKKLSQN